jgi:DUF1680 family protein
MSELQDHLAVARDNVLYVGVYADARITAGELTVTASTNYPWDGEITLTVEQAPMTEQAIALRIPQWATGAELSAPGQNVNANSLAADDGWVVVRRTFAAGDVIRLTLPMAPRAHGSHPYVDATRGAIAVARGPLVYCVEQQDVDAPVDDLLLTPSAVRTAVVRQREDHVALELTAGVAPEPPAELYPVITEASKQSAVHEARATFVPYFLWGNRQALAMRVWLRTEREG